MFLFADRGVRRLLPVPLAEQAEALARIGEYSEALAMAALLDDEQEREAAAAAGPASRATSLAPDGAELSAATRQEVRLPRQQPRPC